MVGRLGFHMSCWHEHRDNGNGIGGFRLPRYGKQRHPKNGEDKLIIEGTY